MNIINSTILSIGILGTADVESKDISQDIYMTRNNISSVTNNNQVLENSFIMNNNGKSDYENAVESLQQMEDFVNDTTVIIEKSFNTRTMTKLIQENVTLTKKNIENAKNANIDVSVLEQKFNKLEKEVYIKAAQYNITFLENHINKIIYQPVNEELLKTHHEEAIKLIQLANAAGADISEIESRLKRIWEKL